MFVELYEYAIKPGLKDDWERFMIEHAVPYQTSKGMRILGLAWADGDDTRFVWARAFNDDDERAELYAAVYESELWQTKMLPEVRRIAVTGSSKTTRLEPFGTSTVETGLDPAETLDETTMGAPGCI